MKTSTLIVIFDFLIATLLLFVVAPHQKPASSRPLDDSWNSPSEFSPSAIAAMESEWNDAWNLRHLELAKTSMAEPSLELPPSGPALASAPSLVEPESELKNEPPSAPLSEPASEDAPRSLPRSPGSAMAEARLELTVRMIEKDRFTRDDTWTGRAYAPIVRIQGERFLPVFYRHAGLHWKEMLDDGDLASVEIVLAGASGPDRWSVAYAQSFSALAVEPRLLLFPIKNPEAREIPALPLLGREALKRWHGGKLRLFKATASGLSFEVEGSIDLSDDRYFNLRPHSKLARLVSPAGAVPQAGDYLMTPQGHLAGVLVDHSRCYILDDSDSELAPDPFFPSEPLRYRDAARKLYR